MTKLQAMEDSGLPVDWAVIHLGWTGPGTFHRALSLAEVKAYADARIESSLPSELEDLAELSTLRDEAAVGDVLSRLAANDDRRRAERVWQIYLLSEELERVESEKPTEILYRLGEFWNAFGAPADSPLSRDGCERPETYYSSGNAQAALAAHRTWIAQQSEALAVGHDVHGPALTSASRRGSRA